MSDKLHISKSSQSLFTYWSLKFGQNETIILIKYVKKMAKEVIWKDIPYEFDPMIEFHLHEMPEYFAELTKKDIKKALMNLRRQGVVYWSGNIENCEFLFFLNHKDLLEDFFSRKSYV